MVKFISRELKTTTVSHQLKFKNKTKFNENGKEKKAKQKVKEEIEVKVESETIKTKTSREDGKILMLSELEHDKWNSDSSSVTSAKHYHKIIVASQTEYS